MVPKCYFWGPGPWTIGVESELIVGDSGVVDKISTFFRLSDILEDNLEKK